MKSIIYLITLLVINTSFAQTSFVSKTYGLLEFNELDHGLGQTVDGTLVNDKKSPTGNRGWLEDYWITEVTDSIRAIPKANFGVIYMVRAKDTVDINIDIEWIYPEKIINEKGEKFKSIRYTTSRPTNIPSGSSYSLDEPYELLKGQWIMNMYVEKRKYILRRFFFIEFLGFIS